MHLLARWGRIVCRLSIATMVLAGLTAPPGHAATKATTFQLANGMQIVVIPDHRVPVVTHMVWYRIGAADDPSG